MGNGNAHFHHIPVKPAIQIFLANLSQGQRSFVYNPEFSDLGGLFYSYLDKPLWLEFPS